MAVTTVPQTTAEHSPSTRIRRVVTWVGVAAAVAAAGLLAVQVFASDSTPASSTESGLRASGVYALSSEEIAYLEGILAGRQEIRDATSPGELSALEVGALLRDFHTPAVTAEQGSITAIDHRAEQVRRFTNVSPLFAEQGSIAAIDHRAEQPLPGASVSQLFAERGSIAAIDHRVE